MGRVTGPNEKVRKLTVTKTAMKSGNKISHTHKVVKANKSRSNVYYDLKFQRVEEEFY